MLTRKEIQMDLLNKLNELCDKANVKYALHSQAAYLAYFDEPIEFIESFEVIMCQGDAEKIADILDDDKYYFEDFRVNPKFDRHYMMFGYRDSLDLKLTDINFETERHIENNCVRITIYFIEHQVPKGHAKKLKSRNDLWKLRHMNVNSSQLWRKKYQKKLINLACFLIGNKRINKRRYEYKKLNYAIDTWDNIKNYPFVRFSGKKLKSSLLNEVVPTKLEGIPSYILKDFEPYFKIFYGGSWKDKKWGMYDGFKSSTLSWEEFSNNPKIKECLDEIQRNNEIMYFDNIRLKNYQKTTNKISRHVLQSENVVITREKYAELKDEIIKAHEENDVEKLGILLNPLIESMKESLNLNYSYSVDEDIDRILDEYLRKNKNKRLANKIKKFKADI
ncbi:hypothetical protein [Methanobrevibacter sp.]|uniref:hypothetical protein n=1 Tax=Methanobrevibacter sp. TaxID=66852 RepID=UPI00386D0ABC